MDGFTEESLERLLAFRLSKSLSNIASGALGFEDITYQVLLTAKRYNWLGDLVSAMIDDNPDNPKVSSLSDFDSLEVSDVNREYNGLSSQLRALSQDIYKLQAAVFGDSELRTDGILSTLRAINERIDSLSEDVRRLDESLQSMTRTIPKRAVDERGVRLFAGLLLAATVASLAVSALVSLGVLGG